MFGKLFKRRPKLPPADLSVLKADMHSHFIPGIDDGAQTIEESVALIQALVEMGYSKVVTTPHIMSDYYRNTPEIINEGLQVVRQAVKEAGLSIEVEAAAEYYLDHDFLKLIEERNLLTFGDNYVLFELSFMSEPTLLAEAIFNLQTAGYRPVLAHVERYGFWYKQYDKYEELADKGVLLQMNFNSVTSYYSPEVKKSAEWLIDNNLIKMLGTDCHNERHLEVVHHARTEEYLHKLLESGTLINSTL